MYSLEHTRAYYLSIQPTPRKSPDELISDLNSAINN